MMQGGDIAMSTLGRQLLAQGALPQYIYGMLRACAGGILPEEQVLSHLMESHDPETARRIMRTAVEWGRYGELYEFDFHTRRLRLA